MASKTIAVLFFWVVLALMVWYTDKIDSQYTSLDCDTEPEGENYCEVTEGAIAWFDADVSPEGEWDTTLIWTEGGIHPESNPENSEFENTEEASPGFDYAPIVVESDAYLYNIPIEMVDDCDVEKKETFHTILATEPTVAEYERYVDVIIVDNDDSYFHLKENYDILETEGLFEFEVCRDAGGVLAASEITYNTVGMTAVDTSERSGFPDIGDYVAPTEEQSILEFDETEECKKGTVEIISDLNSREESEVFAIDLNFIETSATGCTGKVASPGRALITIHDAESILYWIEFCDYSVTEPKTGSSEFKFNIMRKGNTAIESDIVLNFRAVSATTNKDYKLTDPLDQGAGISFTLTFQPTSETVEASITIEADATQEDPETFEVSLSIPTLETGIITEPSKAIVTIHDFNTTKSCGSFDSSVNVVMESDGNVKIKVRRKGNLETTGRIDIMTTNVDASDSTDYVSILDTLLFGIGQQEMIFSISITDDFWKEDTECFKVTLSTPNNGDNPMDVCSPESTNVMIKNDDDQFHFEGVYYRVFENDGKFEINVIRSGYLGKTSYAYVTTEDNNDYDIITNYGNNRIRFEPNEWIQTLQINIKTNDGYEGEEEFFVKLEAIGSVPVVSTQQIGAPYKATIVIYDDFACSPPCVNGECIHENICECPPSFTGTLCETPVKVIAASFTIIERPPGIPIQFTPDLYDSSSAAYIELAQETNFQLEQAYSALDNFLEVIIIGFSAGSVKVDYQVKFAAESDSNLADVSQKFTEAVNSGAVLGSSNLKLSPSDIDCPIGYCQNGGLCATTDTSYFCECASGFSGVQCSTPIFDPSADGDEEGGGDAGDSSQMSDGTIVAIIIGIMFLLFLFALLACILMWMIRRRRRLQRKPKAVQPLQQVQYELRPYNGMNPAYAPNDGVLGMPPLY